MTLQIQIKKNTFYKNKIMHCSVYALIAFCQNDQNDQKIAEVLSLLNMLNRYIGSIGGEKEGRWNFFVIC